MKTLVKIEVENEIGDPSIEDIKSFMRKILENATEIHTIQTGMFDFCNSIKLNCPIFLHTYVRKYPNEKRI